MDFDLNFRNKVTTDENLWKSGVFLLRRCLLHLAKSCQSIKSSWKWLLEKWVLSELCNRGSDFIPALRMSCISLYLPKSFHLFFLFFCPRKTLGESTKATKLLFLLCEKSFSYIRRWKPNQPNYNNFKSLKLTARLLKEIALTLSH